MDNKKIISIALLVTAFSIVYYLVIFLPKKEELKLQGIKIEQEAKDKRINNNRLMLDTCLNDIDTRQYEAFSDTNVKLESLDVVQIAIGELNKQRDNCFKKYPVN